MQEMEWHLFSIIILFGMSVALLEEGHVRVDFLYDRFSVRTKAVINIIGTVFFPAAPGLFGVIRLHRFRGRLLPNQRDSNPKWPALPLPYQGYDSLSFAMLIFTAIGYTVEEH